MSINDLKAKVYDLISEHEKHIFEMNRIKKEIESVNLEIAKLLKEKNEEVSS